MCRRVASSTSATYHPFDIVVGVTLTVALLLNAFRFFTPNEVFPVTYRQGKTAHLDVGGRGARPSARPSRTSSG